MVVIDDCTKDEQVNASPYVVASPYIRFYAGAALLVDGVKVRVGLDNPLGPYLSPYLIPYLTPPPCWSTGSR